MTRSQTIACGMACVGAMLVAAPATTAVARTTITMSGSTSVAPLAAGLAKAYLKNQANRRQARFKLLQGGSDIGINDVARGRVTIGNSSRDPQPSDPGGLIFNKIARDALCVATNRANPIGNLSQAEVQAIFSGRVRNWRDVPGSRVSGPIDLIVRTPASGTQDAFQSIFMGPDLRVASSAQTKSSNGLQQQAIRSNENAIGYVSFNFTKGLHLVPYKGVACTLRNAKSGQYGGSRNFWMVTRGKARGEVARFIKWIRSAGAARRVISTNWVPLR
ncbi:MAG TPA: phosphate ABC transporter substrate-binding protein [Thermoleophilaceae bacterium]|nr:phosphate ABC transporter substrate-binding protein [Thermoleophilaceae bacterium]